MKEEQKFFARNFQEKLFLKNFCKNFTKTIDKLKRLCYNAFELRK